MSFSMAARRLLGEYKQITENPPEGMTAGPVNEDNFFRRRRGIIGNMSIREAFELAAETGIKEVFPVHWDMFKVNSAIPKEIKIIYDNYSWPFKLTMGLNKIKIWKKRL